MNTIYTIGHSTQTTEEFIDKLKLHNINCVVDVRSVPYSQYASQFDRENISRELKANDIAYIYMGKEFGARRENTKLYDAEGKLDFEKAAEDSDFKKGESRLKEGLSKDFKIALMCTEKNPIDCHRCILVARNIQDDLGVEVANILDNGELVKQDEIEQTLLEMYFPQREQISLFEENNKSDKELIKEAYRKHSKNIAYQI